MKRNYKNIVLITLDSLRYDMLPVILKAIKEYKFTHFKKAYSNGPGTLQSFPSLLASSSIFLIEDNVYVGSKVKLMSDHLARHGYFNIGIHSNPFLSKKMGWSKGFNFFFDGSLYSKPPGAVMSSKVVKIIARKRITELIYNSSLSGLLMAATLPKQFPYMPAHVINNVVTDAINIYSKHFSDKPLFLWIHYMDTHWPYYADQRYVEKCGFNSTKEALIFQYKHPISFSANIRPRISKHSLYKLICLYKSSVQYVSENICKILDLLNEKNILDRSVVVITGDHGEAFMEHGYYGHPFNAIHNTLLQVPFLIRDFSNENNHINNQSISTKIVMQHRHIAPTLLSMAGIKKHVLHLGHPILEAEDLDHMYPIISETVHIDNYELRMYKNKYILSIMNDRYKLVIDIMNDRISLFDVERDKHETKDILHGNVDIAKELFKEANRFIKRIVNTGLILKKIYKIRGKIV